MRVRSCLSLPLAAILAMSFPLGGMQALEEQKGNPPAETENSRKSKIEALTVKQKAADKEQSGSSKAESKTSADSTRRPIGVNEPGVNLAPKPITVTEEGVENQPTKGKSRSVEPTKQAGPEGKPGKGEPQPAKKQ